MSVGKRGLDFLVIDFIGFIGTAKMRLAILAFLYCGEFVKMSMGHTNVNTTAVWGDECNTSPDFHMHGWIATVLWNIMWRIIQDFKSMSDLVSDDQRHYRSEHLKIFHA